MDDDRREQVNNNDVPGTQAQLSLMDGATPDAPNILVDTEEQIGIAASSAYSLEERLEAYEDILESQVGCSTPPNVRDWAANCCTLKSGR